MKNDHVVVRLFNLAISARSVSFELVGRVNITTTLFAFIISVEMLNKTSKLLGKAQGYRKIDKSSSQENSKFKKEPVGIEELAVIDNEDCRAKNNIEVRKNTPDISSLLLNHIVKGHTYTQNTIYVG